MNWLRGWTRRAPRLDMASRQRLDAWRQRAVDDLTLGFNEARYVVVDVESTGLDLNRDHLIAIGACIVQGGRVSLADSLEIVLRQEQVSSKENILIHGIGGQAQRGGLPPVEGLLRFLEFLGDSPLVAFHVTFDQTMIKRAFKQYLGFEFKHPWLDLAYVMPGLMLRHARQYRVLDDWSGHFGIPNFARHNALADALVTAQLLLCAQRLAAESHSANYRDLRDLEKAQRWVSWAN